MLLTYGLELLMVIAIAMGTGDESATPGIADVTSKYYRCGSFPCVYISHWAVA